MFNTTDLITVDKEARIRNSIASLIKGIRSRMEYASKLGMLSREQSQLSNNLITQLELVSLLDITKIIDHTLYGTINQPRKELYASMFPGLPKGSRASLTPFEQSALDTMSRKAGMGRVMEHQTHIGHEIAWAHKQGWYMIFQTLTVAQQHYGEVFSADSTAFKNYIRRVENWQKRLAYGSVRQARNKPQVHKYFAVTEIGGKRGRLHFHVLHLFKTHDFSDPNAGRKSPTYRIVDSFRKFWPYGFTTPIAVRYSGDGFTKQGWRWPIDAQTRKPLEAKDCQAIAGYMTKYVSKAILEPVKGDYKWRTKKSRQFGTSLIRPAMRSLTTPQLASLLIAESYKVMAGNRPLPTSMINREALREYSRRLTVPVANILENWCPRPTPVQRLRSLTSTKRDPNRQNFSNFVIENLQNTESYNGDVLCARTALEESFRPYFPSGAGRRYGFQAAGT